MLRQIKLLLPILTSTCRTSRWTTCCSNFTSTRVDSRFSRWTLGIWWIVSSSHQIRSPSKLLWNRCL